MNRRTFIAAAAAALIPVPAVVSAPTRQSNLIGTVFPSKTTREGPYFFVAGEFLYADGTHLPYGTVTIRWQGQEFTGGLLVSGFAVEVVTIPPLKVGTYPIEVELAGTNLYTETRCIGTVTVS